MKTQQLFNVENVRKDFTILKQKVRNKPLIYLDNGATSLTSDSVVKAMQTYYQEYRANVHRGIHALSEKATLAYEEAKQKVADFIHADFEEIIFTKGTTESLNLLAYTLGKKLQKGDEILLSEMEHHSNIVPWQQQAKERGAVIKYIKINEEGELDMQHLQESITKKTKIVSLVHMSNVLGTINDVKEIGKLVHVHGALLIVDGAQSIPHFPIDVKDLDCDFLAFSGHKMTGPTGIGVLYGKRKLLETLDPFLYGGDMISEVSFAHAVWNDLPWKFEAGTPQIAEAIGLGNAVDYLQEIGMDNIREHEESLTSYALTELNKIPGVVVYGPNNAQQRGSVFSFNVAGIHPHDMATILDREGIAIRAGHMCAMPLVTEILKLPSVCRASLYFYNTTEEIDALAKGIKKAKEIFKQ